MKKMKYKTKKTFKSVLSVVLLALVAFGSAVGISSLVKYRASDTKEVNPSFSVGALDSSGEYVKSDESIYTKKSFACRGLSIELDEEFEGSYQVYFYDEDDEFVKASGEYTKSHDFAKELPGEATHARLLVTPELEKGEELNWYKAVKYARKLTVSVLKDQDTEVIESVALFSGLTEQYSVISMKDATANLSPFVWSNTTYLAGKRITRIGVPVLKLKDCTQDQVMTLTLFDISNGLNSRTEVKTISLTIEANTYTSNTINDWVYFDVDIEVGANQTIGFMKETDSIVWAYPSISDSRFTFYNNGNTLATNASIVFDIYVEK